MIRISIICALLLTACNNYSDFENNVFDRALSDPATAEEHFLKKIENGATVKEQAIYLYAMGLANEKMGDDMEANTNFLSAEALGYSVAKHKLKTQTDN